MVTILISLSICLMWFLRREIGCLPTGNKYALNIILMRTHYTDCLLQIMLPVFVVNLYRLWCWELGQKTHFSKQLLYGTTIFIGKILIVRQFLTLLRGNRV